MNKHFELFLILLQNHIMKNDKNEVFLDLNRDSNNLFFCKNFILTLSKIKRTYRKFR